ncbi:hypothetical protein GCM10011349_24060 [Novosphingobium indicum]|uniref:Uncharacterized protein n=1 Tax=Novosphingobium indicum TaxID=462949 RepID=A0ABQ2JSF2_9SPHN|nr:hypothetical protein GCM10011349_24060 [Novosphingobium indicum]
MALNIPKRLADRSRKMQQSQRQEKMIADRIGGKRTKSSGAEPFEKGDVRIKGLVRIEAKTTSSSSFRVTTTMIDTIQGHAVQAGELPIIEVELAGGSHHVAILPVWALDALLDAAKE